MRASPSDVVRVGIDSVEGASGDSQGQFLPEFATEGVPGVFAELDLPSQKLPLLGNRAAVGSADHENPEARGENPYGDDDGAEHTRGRAWPVDNVAGR